MNSLCRIRSSLPSIRCLSEKINSRIMAPTTTKANYNYNRVSDFHSRPVNFGNNIISNSSGEQIALYSTKSYNEDLDFDRLLGSFNGEIRDMVKDRSMNNNANDSAKDAAVVKNNGNDDAKDGVVLKRFTSTILSFRDYLFSYGDYFYCIPIPEDIIHFHVTVRGSYLTFEETYGKRRHIFTFPVDRDFFDINSLSAEVVSGILKIRMKAIDNDGGRRKLTPKVIYERMREDGTTEEITLKQAMEFMSK